MFESSLQTSPRRSSAARHQSNPRHKPASTPRRGSIRCSREDVALMRRIARVFLPSTRPSYKAFGLVKAGSEFLWIVR
jgi:hypothetical protein